MRKSENSFNTPESCSDPNIIKSLGNLREILEKLSFTCLKLSVSDPSNILVQRFRAYVKNYYELKKLSTQSKFLDKRVSEREIIDILIESIIHSMDNNLNLLNGTIKIVEIVGVQRSLLIDIKSPELLPKYIYEPVELAIIQWIVDEDISKLGYGYYELEIIKNLADIIKSSINKLNNSVEMGNFEDNLCNILDAYLRRCVVISNQRFLLVYLTGIIVEITRNMRKYGVNNTFGWQVKGDNFVFDFTNEKKLTESIQTTYTSKKGLPLIQKMEAILKKIIGLTVEVETQDYDKYHSCTITIKPSPLPTQTPKTLARDPHSVIPLDNSE